MMRFLKYSIACLSSLISTLTFAMPQVKLSTANNYKPFTDEKLKGKGLFTKIVEKVVTQAGYQPLIDFSTWNRAEGLTKLGKSIGTFPYMKTPEREKEFIFSDVVYSVKANIIVLAASDIKFDSLENSNNLNGKTFCKPKGYGIENYLQDKMTEKKVFLRTVKSMDICLNLLLKNKIDFIVESPVIFYHLLKQQNLSKENFKILPQAIQTTDLRLMLTKENKDAEGNDVRLFIEKFNSTLAKMNADKSIDTIIENYF
jgi:polar amino acid transport system substrate-binding protein